ncbi:glycosyltransferase involved in cell wall biosynthesis [Catalinimonas alkaloidigena]|uniref:glycosyltransferase family 2 protein n=1 Tax=Catalinimonas alkaloidigena TaxID=1075417 RepID=UPI002406F938|nr:glycosyltransferase family 2 protein [Catalinimonas alkaloidigena]MDF9795519.1 glycosyltransferase involved in cell wall biosynthesis [Catalinimonas alkaloidigena]
MHKVTAIIPTFNEEDNIEEAIKSVSWADEIMVVDSFSTDATVEIARKHTDFVLQHQYVNSAAQKNWAIPQAKYPWIFLLDADERVTPELAEEIQKTLKKGTQHTAFRIWRKNMFMGRMMKHGELRSDNVVRLFLRDKSKYQDKHVHAGILTEGSIGIFKYKLLHNTYKGFDHFLSKVDQYSTWGAYDKLPKTKKVTLFHLWLKPAWRFFKQYIIQLAILDGRQGFIYAQLMAYTVFLRYVKLYRIQQGEKFRKDK